MLFPPLPPQCARIILEFGYDSIFLVNRYWSPSFEEGGGWDLILTQNHEFDKILVEICRERPFLRIKKAKEKNISKGLGWGH
jgi:hypothetical protein